MKTKQSPSKNLDGRGTSRRTFVKKTVLGLIVAASGGVGLASNSALAKKKLTQKQARYQDEPKNKRKCADCKFFMAKEEGCEVVEGKIKPEGWCVRFAKKPS